MTDVKVEFIGADGKYDSVTLNGDHVIEVLADRDMWSIRDAVKNIIKHELSMACMGIISVKRVDE